MQIIYPVIWLAFIICLFMVWFFTHRANHRERMLKIEKGIDDEKDLTEKKNQYRFSWFRLACLVTGLSLGLLIISLLAAFGILDKGGNVLPLAILGFCGGLSLIIAHYLQKDKHQSK
jgi:1,4-dihydroxy-2-naphthoate octaprenyltransferase